MGDLFTGSDSRIKSCRPIYAAFLNKGTVVTTENAEGHRESVFYDGNRPYGLRGGCGFLQVFCRFSGFQA
jgi:hypothetical protein